MPILRRYRVFISHVWNYGDDYWRVVRFLDEAPYFQWENLSVPEHDPVTTEDLAKELRNQMRPADVFLIIAGRPPTPSADEEFGGHSGQDAL